MFRTFVSRFKRVAIPRGIKTIGWSSTVLSAAAFMTAQHDGECPSDLGWFQQHNKSDGLDFNKRDKLLRQKINCKNKKTMNSIDEMKKYEDVLHDNWEVHEIDGKWHLMREFYVDTMDEIKDITNTIFEVSDQSNYHPDILISGHKMVTVDVYSYKLDGLRAADFVLAARIDVEIEKLWKQYMDDQF